ncbi:MAG: HvfC/BufC family peptide modification chaperone, partial [Burkholderiaceae bacterium]
METAVRSASSNAMPLRAFQDAFAYALMANDAASPVHGGLSELVEQPAFAVYRNTVLKGCIDALQANYPSVERLVGEEWFRAAAAVYARHSPPTTPVLLDYGDGFADFLHDFPPAQEFPYLPGVAQLDRAWTEAHVAADREPVAPTAIAALTTEQLGTARLRPHPAARWLHFNDMPIFS